MEESTKNSSERLLEKNSERNAVSINVSFAPDGHNHAGREVFIKPIKPKDAENTNDRASFSKLVFRRRNAIAVAAILAIGVLHFAFQVSFIRLEHGGSEPIAELPAPVRESRPPVEEANPAQLETQRIDAVLPAKNAPLVEERRSEISAPKPQSKKKESVAPGASRLRRAEKILTGI